ncbi:MAG: hypothetical protein JJ899_13990, partial [Alphaproteobacteria bacterium]|nr:hypothetical protein [Alphaproteobacteria bacterium]
MERPTPDGPAAPSRQPNNLALRVMSAAILAPVALWCVWEGGLWYVILVAIGAGAAGAEWRRMSGLDAHGIGPVLVIGPLFVVLAGEAMVPLAGLVVVLVAAVVA